MNHYLVIIPANGNSLHIPWLEYERRSFDVFLVDYSKEGLLADVKHDYYMQAQGAKWTLIAKAVEQLGERILKYKYVFLPDDDIFIRPDHLNKMFQMAGKLKLDIGQPSLTRNSYMDISITVSSPLLNYRRTSYVEVMMPFMKSEHLLSYLPYLKEAQAGWWLENVWYRDWKEKRFRLGILDCIIATHTRAFNAPAPKSTTCIHKGMYKEMTLDPWEEREAMIEKYALPQHSAKTLSSHTVFGLPFSNLYGRHMRKSAKKAKFCRPEH